MWSFHKPLSEVVYCTENILHLFKVLFKSLRRMPTSQVASKRSGGERLDCQLGEGGHILLNGAQAAQQNVRAISIGFEVKFATEFSQPKHGFEWPMLPREKTN